MGDTEAKDRVLTIKASGRKQKQVVVEIADRGSGLGNGMAETIFRPLYTTKRQGFGMGLAIARSIIEAHGGTITARNNPEKGATISFTLPVGEKK